MSQASAFDHVSTPLTKQKNKRSKTPKPADSHSAVDPWAIRYGRRPIILVRFGYQIKFGRLLIGIFASLNANAKKSPTLAGETCLFRSGRVLRS